MDFYLEQCTIEFLLLLLLLPFFRPPWPGHGRSTMAFLATFLGGYHELGYSLLTKHRRLERANG